MDSKTTRDNEEGQDSEDILENTSDFSLIDSFQEVRMTTSKKELSPKFVGKNSRASNGTETMTMTAKGTESCQAEVIPELESPDLQVGDHVYQWRSLCGVPYMFQHHGIVMDIIKDEDGNPTRLTIADFSNVETKPSQKKSKTKVDTTKTDAKRFDNSEIVIEPEPEIGIIEHSSQQNEAEEETANTNDGRSTKSSSRRLSLEQEGIMRTYTDTDKWHKVHYQSGWWKRQLCRSGTATKAKSDPVGLVLARVNFIMQYPEQLPDYHVVHANCECVAFWCKTGRWSTLQASSFLELTAAGQAKSSATLAATAAGATSNVTVPAAGIWGSWFGFTTSTSVSWLSLHPMAIPGLACYAAITVGVPAIMYAKASKKWKETSQRLCDAFWDSAAENPDVFAECLTHWSDKE